MTLSAVIIGRDAFIVNLLVYVLVKMWFLPDLIGELLAGGMLKNDRKSLILKEQVEREAKI